MSVLKSSIENLYSKIVKLEGVIGDLESSIQGQQPDMFASPPSNENGALSNKVEVAQRLDNAIEKVEQLLKSSAGQ